MWNLVDWLFRIAFIFMNTRLSLENMTEFEDAYRRVFREIDEFSTGPTLLGKLSISLLSATLARQFVVGSEPTMMASRAFGDLSGKLYEEIEDHSEYLRNYIQQLDDAPRLWRWWAEKLLYTVDGKLTEVDNYNRNDELKSKVLPESESGFADLLNEVCDAHNDKTWDEAYMSEFKNGLA